MKRMMISMTVMALIFSLAGCSSADAMDTNDVIRNETEESEPILENQEVSIYDCGYVPFWYAHTAYNNLWYLINIEEGCILNIAERCVNSFYQWNSSEEKTAYYFVGSYDGYFPQIEDQYRYAAKRCFYTSDGQFLGISFDLGLNGSTDGYAVIHTLPDEAGDYWSIVISEHGDVIAEVPSSDYVIYSWNRNGYSLIAKDGMYGYMDSNGTVVIDCQYKSATEFTEDGYAAVSISGSTFIIDKQGERIKEYSGVAVRSYEDEYLYCQDSDYYYLMDLDGNVAYKGEKYLSFVQACNNGSVVYCLSNDDRTYSLYDMADGAALIEGADFIRCSENGTLIVYIDGAYHILNQNLEERFPAPDGSVKEILGGNYFLLQWQIMDESRISPSGNAQYTYYTGIADAEGNLITYGCTNDLNIPDITIPSSDSVQTYDACCFEEYDVSYPTGYTYKAGSSAWGTAQFGLQALFYGDAETCVSCFLENADGTLGDTGMDTTGMSEMMTSLGKELDDDYGNYDFRLYVTDYRDVSGNSVAVVSERLGDTGRQVEAVRVMKGNYLLYGDEDVDTDMEDNEFEVTVVCVDGIWYLWSF